MNLFRHHRLMIIALVTIATMFITSGALAMNITIVTSKGKTVAMNARQNETVADVKDFVYDTTGIHQGTQRLYKGNELLEGDNTLASYGIADGDTLHVRLGTGTSRGEKESGGLFRIILILLVLAVIVVIIKTALFGKGGTPEGQENQ